MNKHFHSRALRVCCAALMLTAGAACSQIAVTPAAPVPPVATAATTAPAKAGIEPIIAAIGDAACDNTQQCRTLAVGRKACGGPEQYLAFSIKRSDEAQLTALAQRQAAEQKAEDQRTGMVSTCSLEPDPGATCSAGRCVLNKGASASSMER